jgi:hypothetical protein
VNTQDSVIQIRAVRARNRGLTWENRRTAGLERELQTGLTEVQLPCRGRRVPPAMADRINAPSACASPPTVIMSGAA